MVKEFNKIINWIKTHKLAVLAIFLAIIFMGSVVLFVGRLFLSSMIIGRRSYDTYKYAAGSAEYAPLSTSGSNLFIDSYERKIDEQASDILSEPTEYQIKKGSVTIKSKDSSSEYEILRQRTQYIQGWVENMKKHEDYTQKTITTTLKIPFESFDSFTEWMVNNFDVKDANLELYRVEVEKQRDEMQILMEALDVYDRLLVRAEGMEVTEESIEVIMKITQKRLEVMRLLRNYGYSIEKIEEKSDYATITVTLKEEKKIKIMPEDLGKELRIKMRNAISNISEMGLDLLTIPLVVLVKTITYILYVVIVIVPVFIAYKIMRRILKWIGKKI
jgi:hypothetical protein